MSLLISVRPYAGKVDKAVAAMKAFYSGAEVVGAERAADSRWPDGARRLVKGERL